MKYFFRHLGAFAALLICSGPLLQAQIPGGSPSPMNTAMFKMFGKHTNFTAQANLRMLDDSQKEITSIILDMSLLDGKMRVDMNMANMKSAMLTPQILEQMQKMGADHTILVVRPDLKASYVIYPALKAYTQMPMSDAEIQTFGKDPKMDKTPLGKETIDGHPCVKNKILVTDDKGKTQEATVWNATDLKDFSLQIQMKEKEATAVMKFKNVQLTKPDAKQYEPPAGYTKYQDMQQLQQVMMQKMVGTPAK